MDHLRTDTDEDLLSGDVALVVFLPDAIEGRLIGALERWIRDRTGCAPIARQWVSYTDEALERFYPGLAERVKENWRLLCEFFSTGPCLATLWLGDNATQSISAVKGQTHPARCAASTLRGGFWCDNTVANLVHVSDDGAEVVRELGVLRSLEPDLFSGPLAARPLAPFLDSGPPAPRHSAILTLCSVVDGILSSQGCTLDPLDVPDGGDARETMARAEAWLGHARTRSSPAVAGLVGSYLDGTAEPSRFIPALKAAAALAPWEELILRCGVLSRSGWMDDR